MDELWEKVLKMPTTMQGEKYGYFNLAAFPELEDLVFSEAGKWMDRFNKERTMVRWFKRKNNIFRPRLVSNTARGLYGKVNINNWQLRERDVEYDEAIWGEMDRASQIPDIRDVASGRATWTLNPDELGVSIIEDVRRPHQSVVIDIPADTNFIYMPETVPLTNAEAAALYIRTYYDTGGAALKQQRKLFADFGLGDLVNIKQGENPIIMSLVEKGLFRLNRQREKDDNLKGFPEVTPRGRAAAPDMDKPDFVTGFKEQVLENPNDDFLFIPEGIKEDDWFMA